MEKPKEERRQIETPISIPPIQPVSTIETGEISDELERPTVDLVESESEDFFDAAERFGFPMETEEDYNEFEAFANDNLEFSDTTKKWELTEEAKNRVVTPITPQQITELPPQIDPIQKPEILRPYEGEVDTTERQEDKFVTAAQDILGVDLYGEWENIKADETLSEQERNEKMTELLERTENRMVYDEESDTYREKTGGAEVGEITETGVNVIDANIQQINADIARQNSAANSYGVDQSDMIKNESGDWVPKVGAKNKKYGDTWVDMGDGTMGWADDAREQYFALTDAKGKLLPEAVPVSLEKLETHEAVVERNKLILDAKEYYGPDVRITPSKLEEFKQIQSGAQYPAGDFVEIQEEDDESETSATTINPNVTKSETYSPILPETEDKPKQIPFMKKVSFEKYDKIFENAIKGGALQKNLLKRGYIPQNLR